MKIWLIVEVESLKQKATTKKTNTIFCSIKSLTYERTGFPEMNAIKFSEIKKHKTA